MDVGDQTPDMALVSGPGEIKRLSDWGARPIVLIFLRHLACLPCQAHLVEVRGCYQEILRLGAEVVVVSFEPVERLPAYRRLHGWPFPVVSDPARGVPCVRARLGGLGRAAQAARRDSLRAVDAPGISPEALRHGRPPARW